MTPTPTPELANELFVLWNAGVSWESKLEDELVPRFTDEYDIDIDVDLEFTVGHRPAWFAHIDSSLEDGNPPGVYYDRLEPMGRYLARGLIEPVDNVLEELVTANGELVLEPPVQVQDTSYLVPNGVILGSVFQYRDDIYSELGLTEPETWEDLLENTRAIDEAEQFGARGFAVAAPEGNKSTYDFTTWFYNAGGQYFRWTDRAETEVEVAFQTEEVRAALEFMRELTEFSPDPAAEDMVSMWQKWTRGDVAQCLTESHQAVELAHSAGNDEIALNTRHALAPRRDRNIEPIDRGWASAKGSLTFEGANRDLAGEFLRFMYEGPERQAEMNLVEAPMYRLPPYREVLETETYQRADLFQIHDGHFLDLQRHALDELAPHLASERPRTPAALYAGRGDAIVDMVRAVVVDGRAIDDEIRRARERLSDRLQEGREMGAD